MIEENPIYKDMVLIEIEPCQAETMHVIGTAEDYIRKNKIKKGQIWCVFLYQKQLLPQLQEYLANILKKIEPYRKSKISFCMAF